MIFTSLPKLENRFDNSVAIIPPPTIFNLLGTSSKESTSLLVKAYFTPSIFGINGLAPVAIKRFSASYIS